MQMKDLAALGVKHKEGLSTLFDRSISFGSGSWTVDTVGKFFIVVKAYSSVTASHCQLPGLDGRKG